ncbi:SGNH/GDSL hydrolase family protein [Nocardia sp. NPDC056952]|uniref:SGNH/GDSL hydrolase family protein n=1 Tax=Nocardia sp. NPDC056952 TaxID=3345979 RepID=UPI0036258749
MALGDSYSAMADHTRLADAGCMRSTRSYPYVLQSIIGAARFDSAGCGDAMTTHMVQPQQTAFGVNPAQFDRLSADVDLVTVTIGANDMGFLAQAGVCDVGPALGDTRATCPADLSAVESERWRTRAQAAADGVRATIESIRTRAPKALIVYVGYARLFPPSGTCATLPGLPASLIEYAYIRHTMFLEKLTGAAEDAGATVVRPDRVAGYDMCRSADVRWVEPLIPAEVTSPIHPNARGAAAIAALVAAALAG